MRFSKLLKKSALIIATFLLTTIIFAKSTNGNLDPVSISNPTCPVTSIYPTSLIFSATPPPGNEITVEVESTGCDLYNVSAFPTWIHTEKGVLAQAPSRIKSNNNSQNIITEPGDIEPVYSTVRIWVDPNGGTSQRTGTVDIGGQIVNITQSGVSAVPGKAGSITGPLQVKQGQVYVQYSTTAIANAAEYVWTLPTGASIVSGNGSNYIYVTFSTSALTGTFSVKGKNSLGTGIPSPNFTVNVLPGIIVFTGSGSGVACTNGSGIPITLSGSETSISYRLYRNGVLVQTINGTGNALNFGNQMTPGTYTISAFDATYNISSPMNYSGVITSGTIPSAAGIITVNGEFAPGKNGVQYTVPVINGATGYNWTLTPGATVAGGANTNSIIVNFSASALPGEIKVYGTNVCGNGQESTIPVQSILWSQKNNNLYFNTGNIGIGTANPLYKLSVKGTIGAGEVKVEVVTGWADFVFRPTYKLRSLYEVEQFIKANSHLPEIPSERQVKEEGIGLGEMNAKLLQKIEELTLYVIELQKQVDELKANRNQQK